MDAYVYDERGNRYAVSEELGSGGQGVVYRVNGGTGRGLAVKVLLDPVTREILQDQKVYRKYLRNLYKIMALPELPNLALPLAPLREPFCGYIMRLMEGMEKFEHLLVPKNREDLRASMCIGGGLRKRLMVLRNLAGVQESLHTRGIFYGDLSPGNVFVSREDSEAEVWLIDADNLSYENGEHKPVGTPCYRAPEIARGERNTILSDRYSFALLAYECLTFSKPFNGSLSDDGAEEEDFGDGIQGRIERGEVPYVHEAGTQNIPRYGLSTSLDQVMTPELQELFLRTFGEKGRTCPRSRPSMRQWRTALDRACEQLVRCGQGHYYHFGAVCPWCTDEERTASDGIRHWRLWGHRVVRFLESPDQEAENDEKPEAGQALEQLYEKRWTAEPKVRVTTVSVPWKALGPWGRGHRPDSPAFEIRCGKSGCETGKVFSQKLKVRTKQTSGELAETLFEVRYLDMEMEFGIAKDD